MHGSVEEAALEPGRGPTAVLAAVGLIWAIVYWGAAALVAWGSGPDFEGPEWAGDFNRLNGIAAGVAACGLVAAVCARPPTKVVLWILAAMAAIQLAGVVFALTAT